MSRNLDFDNYRISNFRYPLVTVSGSYTAKITDYIIVSSGNSITLPRASSNKGRLYIIKSTSVDINLGVLLPNVNSQVLTVPVNTCKHIVSNGSTWVDITPG